MATSGLDPAARLGRRFDALLSAAWRNAGALVAATAVSGLIIAAFSRRPKEGFAKYVTRNRPAAVSPEGRPGGANHGDSKSDGSNTDDASEACCDALPGHDTGKVFDEDDEHIDLEDLGEGVDGGSAAPGANGAWGNGEVRRRPPEASPDLPTSDKVSPLLPGKQRIFVKTYGCAHNNSDSEFMMGLLRDYGYTFASKLEDADACIVNSCTVKNPSQDTALTLTRKACEAGKPVVLAGCVPTADSSISSGLDSVSMLGVTQLDRVVEVVEEAIRGNVVKILGHRRAMPSLDLPKVRKNKFVEIIPISGGCLGNCSYCKTKHARGKLSSYTEDAIVARALQASAEGVSEVWMTSEDTGAYGIDIGTNIAALLKRVSDALPAGVMMKLGMTNPPYMLAHIQAVSEVLRRPNVFEFIHIPVQSGSDAVLQAMIREYTTADFRHLANGLRASVPGMTIATDVICGFPAEGEEDHQATMDLIKEFRFPVLNISQFYPRPGTAAARMKKLPSAVVKQRSTQVTQLFDSYTTYDDLVGREERAWFSETDLKHGQTVGHTKGYAKVVVDRDDALLGKSAIVRLLSATKWHLVAKVL
eukprot:TRINITY_DN61992_c0_g1_i1.p1 TRINITY_DN61992_c0_g1~~TRINITY_DN61992_c0_g1_i1.p1  ORF type:complete len:613 (+),score=88.23 TRINITY_DN61992_c0_g1_i1:78-1841(+)